MDPKRYCQEAIQELHTAASTEQSNQRHQRIVVLAYFADLQPAEQDFASQLKLLAASSERSGRSALATAAREVLDDWQTRRAAGLVGVA